MQRQNQSNYQNEAGYGINGAQGPNWQQPAPQSPKQTQPYQYIENPLISQRNVQVNLDKDAYEIWENTQPELREAMINVAIKYFANDPMHMNYFLDKSLFTGDEQQMQPQQMQAQQQQQQQQQPSPTVSMGLDSWD